MANDWMADRNPDTLIRTVCASRIPLYLRPVAANAWRFLSAASKRGKYTREDISKDDATPTQLSLINEAFRRYVVGGTTPGPSEENRETKFKELATHSAGTQARRQRRGRRVSKAGERRG